MTNEELKKALENHQHWLKEDMDGWKVMYADLTGADLRNAILNRADLRNAILRGADLTNANLTGTILRNAILRGAILTDADLTGADLTGADLTGADLTNAILRGAILRNADLTGADLTGAVLNRADLRGAILTDADLTGTILRNADLRGAILTDAKNVPFIPMACPDEGAFIGWKKALAINGDSCIIKLYIPANAKRSSATGRKCRCNKAKVLSITHMLSGISNVVAFSSYDKRFVYRVGEYVEADSFDEDRFNECAPGIHFFINKQEAIDY